MNAFSFIQVISQLSPFTFLRIRYDLRLFCILSAVLLLLHDLREVVFEPFPEYKRLLA